MELRNLFGILLPIACLTSCLASCNRSHRSRQYENGWYHIISEQKDSIDPEPIVTVKDFSALRLDTDAFGRYAITGKVSQHKQNKWADETEKAIGQQIAFIFNDSVITNPQVNGRIERGSFQITSFQDDRLPDIYRQLKKEQHLK